MFIDRWMDGQKDGPIDRQTDRQTDREMTDMPKIANENSTSYIMV